MHLLYKPVDTTDRLAVLKFLLDSGCLWHSSSGCTPEKIVAEYPTYPYILLEPTDFGATKYNLAGTTESYRNPLIVVTREDLYKLFRHVTDRGNVITYDL